MPTRARAESPPLSRRPRWSPRLVSERWPWSEPRGIRRARGRTGSLFGSSSPQRLHRLALDGEPVLVAGKELGEALHVPRVGVDPLADALRDPSIEVVG